LLAAFLLVPSAIRSADVLVSEDYNQWKHALGTNVATAAGTIKVPPGFRVELVRSAEPDEGSWVSLAFDPKGRLVVAREDRGLLRLTLPSDSTSGVKVETINTNLLECRGLLFAHGALYANANNSKGLFRLRDSDGDDQFDEVKLLKATGGGVGHGRNQLALGPDGMIYSIHGDDVQLPAEGVSTNSPLRHSAEDHLLACEWDKVSFNSYARIPYGHLIRTDKDGSRWELVAGGLRNPFGIAFNEAGDLFTYDADMEWDVGLPWYHPTRVIHLVSGGDYGWRRGTGVLPVWAPDTLPSVVDIGVGSPTAVQFGTRSRFPESWRSALFILDWAYGKIYAVHLQRAGASYVGRSEVFASGRPLNVTGVDFGPDGAMYFTTGGRRTQSGLYRIAWVGGATNLGSTNTPAVSALAAGSGYEEILERLRRAPLEEIWQHLDAPDRWERYAARLALESRPTLDWRQRAIAETRPDAVLTALLALARTGEPMDRVVVVQRLLRVSSSQLTTDQQIVALRALSVCFARFGRPANNETTECLARWEADYPGRESRLNQALCELLVYLGSTNVVRKTIPLLESAATQNERFNYLFLLRGVKEGWSLSERRTYFDWLNRAGREFHGANALPVILKVMRQEAETTLTPEEREVLAGLLRPRETNAPAHHVSVAPRKFVKEWTMGDLTDLLPAIRRSSNASIGSSLFVEVGCAQCHRFGPTGGVVGPDLTSVGSRLDRRALLESILEPSRVVAEVYRSTTIITKAGEIFEGRLLAEDEQTVTLGTDPTEPQSRQTTIAKATVESRRISELSSMPAGLLNTLDKDEILALLTWLEGR
jgi:putative heme-binding domain-containing protein